VTCYESIVEVLKKAHRSGVLLLGEINSYRFPGLGLDDFPVCESLMNAVGVGVALTGRSVVVSHDRMDFITCGLDPIINFAAIPEKVGHLPLVIRLMVGHGRGQGPQHGKDLSHFFKGIKVYDPQPYEASRTLDEAIHSKSLSVFVERRINDNVVLWR
jgi:pyruvate/2-oxoglutarate/acetoin dehydrogenase E1 component